jgi:2'-5' RNA ligase
VSKRRCFVALQLPSDVVDGLIRAGEALRESDPQWIAEKWVARANLHVTMRFLGDLDTAAVSSLTERLALACARSDPFELRLAAVSASPRGERARMVWATFDDDARGSCAALARAVEAAAVSIGLAPERREFVPHATLVRARTSKAVNREALSCANAAVSAHSISMSVLSATLFASTLTGQDPIYAVLAQWALGSGAEAPRIAGKRQRESR